MSAAVELYRNVPLTGSPTVNAEARSVATKLMVPVKLTVIVSAGATPGRASASSRATSGTRMTGSDAPLTLRGVAPGLSLWREDARAGLIHAVCLSTHPPLPRTASEQREGEQPGDHRLGHTHDERRQGGGHGRESVEPVRGHPDEEQVDLGRLEVVEVEREGEVVARERCAVGVDEEQAILGDLEAAG